MDKRLDPYFLLLDERSGVVIILLFAISKQKINHEESANSHGNRMIYCQNERIIALSHRMVGKV